MALGSWRNNFTLGISLKPFDTLAVIFSAALVVFTGVLFYSEQRGPPQVFVRGENKVWIFPLDAEVDMLVNGPIGETRVVISSGRAQFVSSPCNDQTCVAHAGLERNGQWSACLPNRVFLLVEGKEENAVDALVW